MSEPKKAAKKPDGKVVKSGRAQANPYPFAYIGMTSPVTGGTYYQRTVSPMIPDRILMTGNKKELEKFYMENGLKLTPADRRYMQARLHTANQLDYLERKALQDIANGTVPVAPGPTLKKGYVGFDKLKLSGPQTSGCGCWSCAMSLLLQSRGIDLSQEEIRAFRPEYDAGQENMSPEQLLTRNRDSFTSPTENADLIFKVLPNTALSNVAIMPMMEDPSLYPPLIQPNLQGLTPEQIQERMAAYRRSEKERTERAQRLYLETAKQKLINAIRQGINDDHSPVILNRGGGHFVTITGISPDGQRLRVEDSYQSCSRPTQYVKVDDLVKEYLAPGRQGLDLTWLKDLPVPEYGKAPEETQLMPADPNVAVMDSTGKITVTEPPRLISVNALPQPGTGLLKAQEIKKNEYMDQREIQHSTGGTFAFYGAMDDTMNPGDYGLPDEMKKTGLAMITTQNLYLPRKARLLKDPEVIEEVQRRNAEAQAGENFTADILQTIPVNNMDSDDYIKDASNFDGELQEDPAEGTFDAFISNQKSQLYTEGPDTAAYIANIYAANVIRNAQEKQAQEEAAQQKYDQGMQLANNRTAENDKALLALYQPHLDIYKDQATGKINLGDEALKDHLNYRLQVEKETISPQSQANIDAMAKLAMPIVNEMLVDATTSRSLALQACDPNGQVLVNAMNKYAKDNYYIEPNPGKLPDKPDWTEKKQVLDEAYAAMSDTGTGRNYLGFRRDRNSDDYNDMMAEISRYKSMLDQGITPSGMQNKQLITKCMKYATGHMKTRWSKETGQLRFDSTMRILQQIMPEKQFQRLLTKVNRARDAQRGDSSYVDKDTYKPMTAQLFAEKKMKEAMKASGTKFTKLCSEALAAKMMADENKDRGEKMIVDNPYDPAVKQQLEQRARQLRQDANFQSILREIPPSENAAERLQLRQVFLGNDGSIMKNNYMDKTRPPQAQNVGAIQN